MALSFPVPLSGFFADMDISASTPSLSEATLIGGVTRGGDVNRIDHGERLWSGTVTLMRRPIAHTAESARARVRALSRAGASFLFTPLHATKPIAQATGPAGVIYDMRDSREMRISSLPTGFILTPGDFIGFPYGSSPLRYALHQVVETATANGSGITGWFEVVPNIRPGAVIGGGIATGTPVCKAVIVPGSVRDGVISGVDADGTTFDWTQTLR